MWNARFTGRLRWNLGTAGLFIAGLVVAGVGYNPLQADIIELKTGQKIEGEVLKERPGELVVDVGVDVVRIPTSEIKSRTGTSTRTATDESSSRDQMYHSAELPVRSIKELAQTYGEGVVLVQTPGGLGSGFVINDRGYCVTNYHVVEKETRIAVTIFHKTEKGEFDRRRIDDVKIIALTPHNDLALLQIPEQKDLKFQSVHLAAKNDLREGDEVFAIGNPLGLERSVSQGIISTRNRNFDGQLYIQTTCQINPGNSGGPLFNLRGEVVGVTNMKLLFGEGLGFAIPVAVLKQFLDNRDAFAFDKTSPNTGFRYLDPPRRRNGANPPRPATKSANGTTSAVEKKPADGGNRKSVLITKADFGAAHADEGSRDLRVAVGEGIRISVPAFGPVALDIDGMDLTFPSREKTSGEGIRITVPALGSVPRAIERAVPAARDADHSARTFRFDIGVNR